MYYGLFMIQAGVASFEFGDHDKECVEFERDDYVDRGAAKRKELKIVRWPRCPTHTQVMAKVAELNVLR